MAPEPETDEAPEIPLPDAAPDARMTPAEAVAGMHLHVPTRGNRKLRRLIENVEADKQIKAWWHAANVNAVVRLAINDHSWVHIQIVTNIALKLCRLLVKHGVQTSLVRDYRLEPDDSDVVVVLAVWSAVRGTGPDLASII